MTQPNPFADGPLNQNPAPQVRFQQPAIEADVVDIWRSGKLVVIHQSLDLPERCIWTNEPGRHRCTLALTYAEPFDPVHSNIKFAYSLSAASWRTRLIVRLFPVALTICGLAIWLWAIQKSRWVEWYEHPITAGVLCTIAGIVLGWWNWQIMSFVRKEGPYFFLRGAKEPFLKSLPEWPGKRLSRR